MYNQGKTYIEGQFNVVLIRGTSKTVRRVEENGDSSNVNASFIVHSIALLDLSIYG